MDPKFEKANEIYFRLGIIYKQQQKYDLSLQCFRYILHNPPRPLTESDIWFQTGHVYEQQKEYEHAKEAYERVLAENPDHAKVLQQLGWLYHQQNTSFCNQTLAIQFLTRSLKSDSNDAQSWYLLGRCYMAEQNYNKAYEAYQQAVYRDARNPTFWCSIGVLYYQINQYRDALDAYSRAIRLNPYISEVWYDLGTLYESCNNQVQDALDAYQRAAELDPTNPHIKQRLELLRKSQNVQASSVQSTPGNAPVPQDVSNPSQYQTGHGTQPLNGASYSQSAPSGPPSSMSAYHTSSNSAPSQRHAADERASAPHLPHSIGPHESGPVRDLPMPSHPSQPQPSSHRRSSGYSQYASHAPREDVRIADIGGGRAPTPSDRSQMNPILPEHNSSNLPSISTRYNKEETRSPGRPSSRTSYSLPPSLTPTLTPSKSISYECTEGHRYEPLHQPASRAMEMDTAVNTEVIKQEPKLGGGEEHFRDEKKFRQTSGVDEDYDESAADALLSIGNPQLGQKRPLEHDHEESKRPRGDEEVKEEEKKEESKEDEPEEGEVEEEVKKEEESKKETMADTPATSNTQSKEESLANETAGSA
ncbi:hypothetical protein G6F36_009049 [Rhizopus arrhizus]|nr:hypothetical protein G6F36_009049 [Rhizopus arrhizus]